MKKTLFILDTNAYRNLASGRYLSNLVPLANEMKIAEQKRNAHSLMSVVVTMELLNHMDESDPDFDKCFKALALQNFHTQKAVGKPGNAIDFIPPLNTLLTQHFFGKNSDLYTHYLRIIEISIDATKDVDPDDWKYDREDIELIKKQLVHEREEMIGNLENLIQFINGGAVDWSFHEKGHAMRRELVGHIKNGQMILSLAFAMLKRAHGILELPFMQPLEQQKMEDFIKYYQPVLNMNNTLMGKFLNGYQNLADPKNKAWNTLNDMQLLAAACFKSFREKDNDVQVILVSEDKAMVEACAGTYMDGNVWKLREYLAYIF
jgi:hypothetical protein